MIPINNSDTAWLIVSDYNQDNNLPYEDLRDDVLNPDVNNWEAVLVRGDGGTNVGSRGRGTGVGGNSILVLYVEGRVVGTMALYNAVGGFPLGNLVGGYEYEQDEEEAYDDDPD
jgi:hypothetical protein